ncbi:MAG: enoyl-CoA hydratase-related protein, partial [Myxococcales bacterium]|nr:enoyl-CoA hydratase-related protein [Myxococcales bacterium]
AEEARRLGLLTDVVPDGELDAAVDALVARLLAQSPSALRHGLDAMAWQQGRPLEEALPELERRLFALLGTEDAREGLTAFLERRTPVWRGH